MNAHNLTMKDPKVDRRFETVSEVLDFAAENGLIPSEVFRFLEDTADGGIGLVPSTIKSPPVLTLYDIRAEVNNQCLFLGLPSTVKERTDALGNVYHTVCYTDAGLDAATDLADKLGLFLSDLVAEAEKTNRLRRQQ